MASSPPREPPREVALATSKRKFDTLLDRITNASTTSLASTLRNNASSASLSRPATPEPVSKRNRLSGTAMESPRVVSGSERIQALKDQLFTPGKQGDRRVGPGLRVVGATKAPAAQVTPRKPANFQPYSQEQFLDRLKTYANVKKWTTKPDVIGEVEWAKRGWSCDVWNTVACKGGCEQRVAVRLRPKRKDAEGKEIEMSEDLAFEVDETLVEKYKALIVDGHHEDCLWRKRGCQDDIYHIPIASRAKSSAELLSRYRSLKSIAADLPLLENLTYPDPRIEDILQRTPPSVFQIPGSDTAEEPPTSSTDTVAFLFAIFGWSGVSESKIALAVCNHCFQRNGLWLSSAARLKEMSQKLDVPIETLRLNLVESHREHCPWKNPDTQRNPPDGPIANMPGWQTQEFMLLGKRRERPRTNMESVDLGSEFSFPRGSMDSAPRSPSKEDRDDGLQEKWKKFKAKLRRTTSRKSLRSVRSGKSGKSVVEKEKENERVV